MVPPTPCLNRCAHSRTWRPASSPFVVRDIQLIPRARDVCHSSDYLILEGHVLRMGVHIYCVQTEMELGPFCHQKTAG